VRALNAPLAFCFSRFSSFFFVQLCAAPHKDQGQGTREGWSEVIRWVFFAAQFLCKMAVAWYLSQAATL
jgi:hypothetical protein